MFTLKPLSKDAIPGAIEKAMRYRLLNEPRQAESICRDILDTDPGNQEALITLILALTDQFEYGKFAATPTQTRQYLPRLTDEYDKAYYAGMICERQAKAALRRQTPHSGFIAYDLFVEAMNWYEKAEKNHPNKNEDAILRWNTCARMIMLYKLHAKPTDESVEPFLDM